MNLVCQISRVCNLGKNLSKKKSEFLPFPMHKKKISCRPNFLAKIWPHMPYPNRAPQDRKAPFPPASCGWASPPYNPKTLNPLHFSPTSAVIDIQVTRNPATATSHPRRLRRADVPPALPARLSRAIHLRRHAPSGRPPASAPPPVT